MHIVLFDGLTRGRLCPLTATRAIADIRIGILTIKERWELITNLEVFVLTEPHLQMLYETLPGGDCLFINASVLPTSEIIGAVLNLSVGSSIIDDQGFIAGRSEENFRSAEGLQNSNSISKALTISTQKRLKYPHEIFQWNDEFLRFDFSLLTKDRVSQTLPPSVQTQHPNNIFVEAGADISPCFLNASAGPIYIGKDVTIMEGCMLRGPIGLCEGATLKMGAKIYGGTTAGPHCVLGGEIKNSIFFANSNKAHDGYIGDSVIGEWCNLGAGTSNSNVKNTAGEVMQWNKFDNEYIAAGKKCGAIIGDYTRTAINTSINTGTVIGVACNVFGEGLTPKYIPDFSWGMSQPVRYNFDKAVVDIDNWKKMKQKTITDQETKVLKHIFENPDGNIITDHSSQNITTEK